jgi:hypothetical protein
MGDIAKMWGCLDPYCNICCYLTSLSIRLLFRSGVDKSGLLHAMAINIVYFWKSL